MADAPRNPPIVNPPIRLAVCVSGEGTTLQNLIDQIRARRLSAEIVQVVASRPRIGAIARAEAAGIPLALANRNARSRTEFSASVFEPIRHSKADLVILGGFLGAAGGHFTLSRRPAQARRPAHPRGVAGLTGRSEQQVAEPAQPDRLATGKRLAVPDADEMPPIAGAVADRLDDARLALGL